MLLSKTSSFFLISALFLFFALFLHSCDDNGFTPVHYDEIGPYDTTAYIDRVETPDGLIIFIYDEGDGDQVTENHLIRVRYTGRTTDGEIFDSSYRNDVDTPATLRVSGMIRGFMQGVAGVHIEGEREHAAREGSERTLVIPPNLGYAGTQNPLNEDTLIFDLEIVSIDTRD